MKSSLFVAASSALLAMAGPINKRAMETEWVLEIITVTVTAGQEQIQQPTDVVFVEEPKPTTTEAPPPPPPTTEAPPPPPPTTEAPPPPPATTAEPEPEPTTEEPAPQPTVQEPGNDYISQMLYHHNIHRANHSAPDLVWDETLAGYAANTANGCVFEHDMNQGDGGYGQNLASWGSSGDISSMQIQTATGGITNQWYNDEMINWSFYGSDNPPEGSDLHAWGHFTQVVWKSSTKLGCATVQCPGGSVLSLPAWYTVCNYNPPGNFGGEYGKNVLEPLGEATVRV